MTQAGALIPVRARRSDLCDLRRLGALGTLRDFEANFVSLVQGLIPVSHNLAKVDEDIVARLTGDETVAFGSVEPLYCSLFHGTDPFKKKSHPQPADTATYLQKRALRTVHRTVVVTTTTREASLVSSAGTPKGLTTVYRW